MKRTSYNPCHPILISFNIKPPSSMTTISTSCWNWPSSVTSVRCSNPSAKKGATSRRQRFGTILCSWPRHSIRCIRVGSCIEILNHRMCQSGEGRHKNTHTQKKTNKFPSPKPSRPPDELSHLSLLTPVPALICHIFCAHSLVSTHAYPPHSFLSSSPSTAAAPARPGGLGQGLTIKLGDLGLGRYLSSQTAEAFSMVGTPWYMSPEAIANTGYEFKSDVWSAGCLLYEMAALRSPFYSTQLNFYTLGNRITSGVFDPPPQHYSLVLKKLIEWMIHPRAEDRPDIGQVLCVSRLACEAISKSGRVSEEILRYIGKDCLVADESRQLKMASSRPPSRPSRPGSKQGNNTGTTMSTGNGHTGSTTSGNGSSAPAPMAQQQQQQSSPSAMTDD